MNPYLVISIIIFVLGCLGYVAAVRGWGRGLVALLLAYLEVRARAAREQQRKRDQAKIDADPR